MASITVPIPDSWEARIVPAVNERALGIEGHKVVQKILESNNVESVEELNMQQRGALVCLFHLWGITAQYETDLAANTARQTAAEAAINEFEPE